jgi:DOPA 4,5-dioxygenase
MSADAPWHAHVYFTPEQREAAAALRGEFVAESDSGSAAHVRFVGPMRDTGVGPHPMPQFEIHFLEGSRASVMGRIEATGLRALVHPLTDDDLADHTTLAQWIGEPLALDLSVLDPPGRNQGVGRFGERDF